ncbi:hypothetical protein DVH24_012677 [Malus domestica]|uniref:Uncharacterized protein n=1 Tax=Malus domestica TaxID=3750 RepID=A0A498HVR8_MALDO|nr:hypothetical protein DVH24_012677 [Malus domestica]
MGKKYQQKSKGLTEIEVEPKSQEQHSKVSTDLDLDCLRLLWLRWRQLLNRHSQNPILANSRNRIYIRILRQHKLPHELANPPLHPHVLNPFLLLLPLPLAADQKYIVVLHLDLYVPGLQPWHVHHEHVGVRVLLDVGWRRGHRLGVAAIALASRT